MATVKYLAVLALVGCSKLQGYGGPQPALATFDVEVTGAPPADADVQVALVWGRQWLVEPFCIVPDDPRDDATTVDAVRSMGCRDPLGFVPARVAASAPLGQAIELTTLPGADVMVGDITARVAYASLIAYDDRNHDGTLNLAVPNRPPDFGDEGGPGSDSTETKDVVVGASFITQQLPDQRVAYREGAFISSGFYPRVGCGDPSAAFSILAASGFSEQEAIDATIAGMLPQEDDPSQCVQRAPASGPVTFAFGSATNDRALAELACTERRTDSTVRYREPDVDAPDFTGRVQACVHSPSFGAPSDTVELIVTGRSGDSCTGLTHYILKGCREGPDCGTPDWDHSLAPPPWWPC
jgi:hypothetical protein